MKHNAMIRIVLWSLLALVLLGILITGLFGYVGRNNYRTSTEATVVQVDLGQTAAGNATQEAILETAPATIPQTTPATAPILPCRWDCDRPQPSAEFGNRLARRFCDHCAKRRKPNHHFGNPR